MAISPAIMIEAVLFDLDNLMVDSEPLHMEASRRVFKRLGKDVDELPNELVSKFYGLRVIETINIMVDYFGLRGKVDVDRLNREQEEIFLEFVKEGLEPMAGLFELVERVKKQGLKRAIASSGTLGYVRLVLERLGLTDFFGAVVTGDMVEKGKPEPDVFLKAAGLLGVRPEKCLVLEDAANGVRAAKKAGMYCIAVDNSIGEFAQDLSSADIVVSSLDVIDDGLLCSFK